MLDRRPCGPEMFQPFSLLSNSSSRCMFHKSQCNKKGQVVYRNGTTTRDRSCRCNYIDNFAFVSKPKSQCYCIPSKEDCSCYEKKCEVEHYLTPGNNASLICYMLPDNKLLVNFEKNSENK